MEAGNLQKKVERRRIKDKGERLKVRGLRFEAEEEKSEKKRKKVKGVRLEAIIKKVLSLWNYGKHCYKEALRDVVKLFKLLNPCYKLRVTN